MHARLYGYNPRRGDCYARQGLYYDWGAFRYTGSSPEEATQLAAENLIWGRSSDTLDDRVRILLDNYMYEQRHIQGGNIATMVVVHPSGSTKVWKWQQ
jgi:hypothetical protein